MSVSRRRPGARYRSATGASVFDPEFMSDEHVMGPVQADDCDRYVDADQIGWIVTGDAR